MRLAFQRNGRRCTLRLLFKKTVYGFVPGEISGRPIPFRQYLILLFVGMQGIRLNRFCRIRHNSLEKHFEYCSEPFDGRAIEQIGVVFEIQIQHTVKFGR